MPTMTATRLGDLEAERRSFLLHEGRIIAERDEILNNLRSHLDRLDEEIVRLGGVARGSESASGLEDGGGVGENESSPGYVPSIAPFPPPATKAEDDARERKQRQNQQRSSEKENSSSNNHNENPKKKRRRTKNSIDGAGEGADRGDRNAVVATAWTCVCGNLYSGDRKRCGKMDCRKWRGGVRGTRSTQGDGATTTQRGRKKTDEKMDEASPVTKAVVAAASSLVRRKSESSDENGSSPPSDIGAVDLSLTRERSESSTTSSFTDGGDANEVIVKDSDDAKKVSVKAIDVYRHTLPHADFMLQRITAATATESEEGKVKVEENTGGKDNVDGQTGTIEAKEKENVVTKAAETFGKLNDNEEAGKEGNTIDIDPARLEIKGIVRVMVTCVACVAEETYDKGGDNETKKRKRKRQPSDRKPGRPRKSGTDRKPGRPRKSSAESDKSRKSSAASNESGQDSIQRAVSTSDSENSIVEDAPRKRGRPRKTRENPVVEKEGKFLKEDGPAQKPDADVSFASILHAEKAPKPEPELLPAVQKAPAPLVAFAAAPVQAGQAAAANASSAAAKRPRKRTGYSTAIAIHQDTSISLEEAAAAGCAKCASELATGEKTRREHSEDCPRKRRTSQSSRTFAAKYGVEKTTGKK